jgi:hypothetical protein
MQPGAKLNVVATMGSGVCSGPTIRSTKAQASNLQHLLVSSLFCLLNLPMPIGIPLIESSSPIPLLTAGRCPSQERKLASAVHRQLALTDFKEAATNFPLTESMGL